MLEFKTTMRDHLTPVIWMISSINQQTVSLGRMWRKGNPRAYWWECTLVQPLWKAEWSFPPKLNMELPFNPEILLLGIYLRKPETLIQKNICTCMFTVVLFKIYHFLFHLRYNQENERWHRQGLRVVPRLICLSGCWPCGPIIKHLAPYRWSVKALPFLWETSRQLCLILLLCIFPISVRYSTGKRKQTWVWPSAFPI